MRLGQGALRIGISLTACDINPLLLTDRRDLSRKDRELSSKSLLNARSVGCGQTVFSTENPMRPICSLLGRINLLEFGRKLVT